MASLRDGYPIYLLLLALRVGLSLVLAAGPAGLVSERFQAFPGGELALLDRGGALLIELIRRPPQWSGATSTFVLGAVVGHVLSVPLVAALLARFAEPRRSLLRSGLVGATRFGPLLLVSGLGSMLLALAGFLGVASATPVVDRFSEGAWSRVAAGGALFALAMIPAAWVGISTDAARVVVVTGPRPWQRRFAHLSAILRARPLGLFGRYVALVVGSAVVWLVGLLLLCRLLLGGSTLGLVGGVLLQLGGLWLLIALRGAWLSYLVRLHRDEVLRDRGRVGYESGPAPSPGSSVGRAED